MSRTLSMLHRFPGSGDPETSSDPRIRALVQDLSRLDYAPAPAPAFRADLRVQLVAIAERVVAEGEPVHGPATLDPTEAALAARDGAATTGATVSTLHPRAERRRRSFGRPVGVAAACVAVLALGLGGAVWKSRSALPGDSLYGLKRASESVQLSLASGNTDRGHEYLQLATTRVQEAQDLLGHPAALASGSGVQAAGVSPQTVALIQRTLRSANDDVTSGSTLLGTAALQSHSARPLAIMTEWAPGQLRRLSQLATDLGSGPAHASTVRSWTLVDSALHRAQALTPQVASTCSATRTDSLGPLCAGATHRRSGASAAPSSDARRDSSQSSSRHAKATHSSTSSSGSHQHSSTHHSGQSGTSSSPNPALPTTLPTSLPTSLPTNVSKVPVSINSCGISAGVGPVGIQIGSCSSGS